MRTLANTLRHAARGCEAHDLMGHASRFYALSDEAWKGTISAADLARLVWEDAKNGQDPEAALRVFFEALIADATAPHPSLDDALNSGDGAYRP